MTRCLSVQTKQTISTSGTNGLTNYHMPRKQTTKNLGAGSTQLKVCMYVCMYVCTRLFITVNIAVTLQITNNKEMKNTH